MKRMLVAAVAVFTLGAVSAPSWAGAETVNRRRSSTLAAQKEKDAAKQRGLAAWVDKEFDGLKETEEAGAEAAEQLLNADDRADLEPDAGKKADDKAQESIGEFLERSAEKRDGFMKGVLKKLMSWTAAQLKKYKKAEGSSACGKLMNKLNGIDPIAVVLDAVGEKLDVDDSRNIAAQCYKGFRDGFICRVPDAVEDLVKGIWNLIKKPYEIFQFFKKNASKSASCGGSKGGRLGRAVCAIAQWAKNKFKEKIACAKAMWKWVKANKGKAAGIATNAVCSVAGGMVFDLAVSAASMGGGTAGVIANWVKAVLDMIEKAKSFTDPIGLIKGVIPGYSDFAKKFKIPSSRIPQEVQDLGENGLKGYYKGVKDVGCKPGDDE